LASAASLEVIANLLAFIHLVAVGEALKTRSARSCALRVFRSP
jgi:hypothetical protein